MRRINALKGANRPAIRRRAALLALFWLIVLLGAALFLNSRRHASVSKDAPPPGNRGPALSKPGTSTTDASSTQPPASPKPSETTSGAGPTPLYSRPDIAEGENANTVSGEDIAYLAARNLLIPVMGVKAAQLRDSFDEGRSGGRRHEAIDIMAPQGTPVLAATDGVVIKLFQSEKGGTTLYELDPSGRYDYYYAHLMRYAADIVEGKELKRGDVIAYVGDTGDAGPGNFHLHFAISKILSPRKWSGGQPINPYPLLSGK